MKNSFDLLLQSLRDRWLNLGIEIVDSVNRDDVEQFEKEHNVRLPKDLKQFYVELNGMDKSSMQGLARLWPFSEITFLKDFLSEEFACTNGKLKDLQRLERHLIIGDYNIEADFWTVLLPSLDGGFVQPSVFRISPFACTFRVVAKDFTEFLNMYLNDSPESVW